MRRIGQAWRVPLLTAGRRSALHQSQYGLCGRWHVGVKILEKRGEYGPSFPAVAIVSSMAVNVFDFAIFSGVT